MSQSMACDNCHRLFEAGDLRRSSANRVFCAVCLPELFAVKCTFCKNIIRMSESVIVGEKYACIGCETEYKQKVKDQLRIEREEQERKYAEHLENSKPKIPELSYHDSGEPIRPEMPALAAFGISEKDTSSHTIWCWVFTLLLWATVIAISHLTSKWFLGAITLGWIPSMKIAHAISNAGFPKVHIYLKVKEQFDGRLAEWNYRYKEFLRTQAEFWIELRGTHLERELRNLLGRLGGEASLTPATGDGGVDIHLKYHGKYVIQCKGLNKKVGVAVARELYGTLSSLQGIDGAILVCPAGFTQGVLEFCSGKRIELWSADTIALLSVKGLQHSPMLKSSIPENNCSS